MVENARVVRDPDGVVIGYEGTLADITERKLAEMQLSEEKEKAQVTLQSIGDAVITTDEEGIVEFLNDVAVTLTGWTREAAIGHPLAEVFRIISEETRQPVENPVTRVIKLGQVAGLANHTILIHRDGSERAIDDSAAPIRDSYERIVGVVLVFRDVAVRRETERRLVRSERELADFFENATLADALDRAGRDHPARQPSDSAPPETYPEAKKTGKTAVATRVSIPELAQSYIAQARTSGVWRPNRWRRGRIEGM